MQSDLIYDVGMNHGQDTAHYLGQGFRVVAVEANPQLVAENRERFAEAIAADRLTILPVGVGAARGHFEFWVNENNDEHSSFVKEVGARNGSRARMVTVECMPFAEILATHGVPFYLKIDIERADALCLRGLSPSDLPRYVSIEAHELEYLALLHGLGYNAFKVIDQALHHRPDIRFNNESILGHLSGTISRYRDKVQRRVLKTSVKVNGHSYASASSGPFAEDTPGEWKTLEEVAYNWLHFKRGYRNRGTLNHHGWFDFHATVK